MSALSPNAHLAALRTERRRILVGMTVAAWLLCDLLFALATILVRLYQAGQLGLQGTGLGAEDADQLRTLEFVWLPSFALLVVLVVVWRSSGSLVIIDAPMSRGEPYLVKPDWTWDFVIPVAFGTVAWGVLYAYALDSMLNPFLV